MRFRDKRFDPRTGAREYQVLLTEEVISLLLAEKYGLEKPLLFEYLTDSLSVMRARTRGVTVETDGSFSEEMTEAQRQCYDGHWLLQYDLMFGKGYALTRMGLENVAEPAKGK